MSTMNPATILLVDDDPLVRDSAARLLQEQGLRVISCGDGYEAMTRLGEGVDAVLSDIKMPGLSGLDLLEKILARDPEMPVLLMTGYADLEMAVAAIQRGVFAFILKPFNPPQLFQSLEKALSHKHLRLFEQHFQTELARRLAEAEQELQGRYQQMWQQERLGSVAMSAASLARSILQPLDGLLSNLDTLQRCSKELLANIGGRNQTSHEVGPLLAAAVEDARTIRRLVQAANAGENPISLD